MQVSSGAGTKKGKATQNKERASQPSGVNPNPSPPAPLTQVHVAYNTEIQQAHLDRNRDSKRQNSELLISCQEQHHNYYHDHIKLLSQVEDAVMVNIKKTKQFAVETYHYFEFIRESYESLLQSLNKTGNAFPYWGDKQSKSWYNHVCEGMSGLNSVNTQISYGISDFISWCGGTFLPQLKKAMEFYQEPLKGYWRVLSEKKEIVKSSLINIQVRYQKIRRNFAQMLANPNYKGDLLFQQLQFVVVCRGFREDLRVWGRAVHVYWETMKDNEASLLNSIKRDIETFFIEIQKFSRGAEKHVTVKNFWASIRVQTEVANGYSLDKLITEELTKYLRKHSKSTTNQTRLVDLIKLQGKDQLIDSVKDFVDILTFRAFQCKTESDRAEVSLLSSVDGNLIFATREDYSPIRRLSLRHMSTRRVNQYTVQVIELIKGFLFSQQKTESLHFNSEDEVEEFIFYVNALKR